MGSSSGEKKAKAAGAAAAAGDKKAEEKAKKEKKDDKAKEAAAAKEVKAKKPDKKQEDNNNKQKSEKKTKKSDEGNKETNKGDDGANVDAKSKAKTPEAADTIVEKKESKAKTPETAEPVVEQTEPKGEGGSEVVVDGDEESKKEACDDVKKEESEMASEEKLPFCGVRLTYFDGAGRAELSRLILAAAGIEFEDRRIDSQDWKELKQDTPFGQVPILEYEGTVITQSIAIARFLAKKADLYGKDDVTQAHADMIVDYVTDFNNKWIPVFRAESYEEQDGLISNLFANFLPTFFENCEALLKSRGGKHFGGGDELTFGDLCAFQVLHSFTDPDDPFFSTLPGVSARLSVLEYHPLLKSLKERVAEVPGIKKWMEKRPRGLF